MNRTVLTSTVFSGTFFSGVVFSGMAKMVVQGERPHQ
ncbi:hypothetical protein [Saccharothrix tamanrassetensis]